MDANGQEYWHEGGGQEDEGVADAGQLKVTEGAPRPEAEGPGKEVSEEEKPEVAEHRPADKGNALGDSSSRKQP